MAIYHIHHIVPRHMGGTDDPSNLIKLTVEEHAEAHKKLWEENGNVGDYIAYKALSGQISVNDASKAAWILGSYKGGYASKPKGIPPVNKILLYCVGCRKRVKLSRLISCHTKCFHEKFNIQRIRLTSFKKGDLRCSLAASKNNSLSICPHCNKEGQYRAMKRWHYDNCKFK